MLRASTESVPVKCEENPDMQQNRFQKKYNQACHEIKTCDISAVSW